MKKSASSGRILQGNGTGVFDPVSVYVYFIFSVFPLLIGPDFYLDITDIKFWIFCCSTAAALLAYVFYRRKGRAEQNRKSFNMPLICLAAFFGWNLISALVSVYSWENIFFGQSRYEGLFSVMLYATAFFLASRCRKLHPSFHLAVSVSACVIAVTAIAQEFGATFLYPEGYSYRGVQFLTTLGQHDCLSGYCSVVLPVLAAGFVLEEREAEKLPGQFFTIFAIILLSYAMLESEVESGRISVLCGLAVVFPFLVDCRKHLYRFLFVFSGFAFALFLKEMLSVSADYQVTIRLTLSAILFLIVSAGTAVSGICLVNRKKEFSMSSEQLRKAGRIILPASAAALLMFVFFYRGSNITILEASELLHGRMDDRAGQLRGYIWKSALDIIRNNLWFGTGPGTFPASFEPYAAGYMKYSPNTGVDLAHNDFLQIAACTGIPGLLFYLLFLGFVFLGAVRCIRSGYVSSEENCASCSSVPVLLAGTAGYLVFSCFGFSIAIYTPLFWAAAGLLAGRSADPMEMPVPLAKTRKNV